MIPPPVNPLGARNVSDKGHTRLEQPKVIEFYSAPGTRANETEEGEVVFI